MSNEESPDEKSSVDGKTPSKRRTKAPEQAEAEPGKDDGATSEAAEKTKCGMVMPISPMDGYPPDHWPDVEALLKEAIRNAGFHPELVSFSDESGVIQKRIVQNLYENEIVVCDVSGRNANIMFELGLRLAFDKPTVIVKDDKTIYPFDVSIIEYVEYPADLHYRKINIFKEELRKRVVATHKKSKDDPKYSTFLKSFGDYQVAKLETTQVQPNEYVIKKLDEIAGRLDRLPFIDPASGSANLLLGATRLSDMFTLRNITHPGGVFTNIDVDYLGLAKSRVAIFLANAEKGTYPDRDTLRRAAIQAVFADEDMTKGRRQNSKLLDQVIDHVWEITADIPFD